MLLLSEVVSEDSVSIDPGTPGALAAARVYRLDPAQGIVPVDADDLPRRLDFASENGAD